MPTHPKHLIWFCDAAEVAKRPDDLKKLRDEIGLTTIMPESFVCHTSGFAASEDIAARGPFEDWRSRTDLYPRAAEAIRKGPLPIAELYEREVRKLKARPGARCPIYPPISANTNPDLLKQLCEAVTQNECDGALFTLDPNNTENLNILRTHLA